MRATLNRIPGRRVLAVLIVTAAVLGVGVSPALARPPLPWITYSLTDSFEDRGPWSNDFGIPQYPCSWGYIRDTPYARTGTHEGSISTCTGGYGTLGRYVTLPAASTQCIVKIWRQTNSFYTATKQNTIHLDVIEPSTWYVMASKIAVANLSPDISEWRQVSTPFFPLNGLTASRTFFVRILQVGTGTSQVLASDLDDLTVVCY